MRNLVDLDLLNADDHALNLLSEISGSLRRLKIWYGTTSTENALLRALTKHTRLQSLGLRDFRPSAPLTHTSRPNAPALFPSLRSLSIASHDVEATLFIDLFPHLRHLALPLRKSLHPPLALDRDTASRWPPLQELYIDISDASLAQHRIRQAEKIFFTVPVQYHELLAIQDPLRAMLRAASPVRLSMIIWVEPGLLHTLVSILAALPRLRTLTLSMQRLQHHYHADPEQEWLVDNVATLKTLQLENLLIVANVEIDRFDSPTPQHLEQEQRSATPVPLHVRLTRTVPTLRLFGVASVYRTTNTDPPEEFDPRYRNLNDPANLWYQPSWVSLIGRGRYHRRWWSVGDGGELTELSPREAKEMDIGSLFT